MPIPRGVFLLIVIRIGTLDRKRKSSGHFYGWELNSTSKIYVRDKDAFSFSESAERREESNKQIEADVAV